MENTGKVLFENDAPLWYVALGDRWIGPLSSADVYQKVLSQEITLAHFVWKPGESAWKRICETETFQGAVPMQPNKSVQSEVKEVAKLVAKTQVKSGSKGVAAKNPPPPPIKPAEKRIWFLYYNDSQYGPFSTEEMTRLICVGKIHGRVYAWRDGMEGWERLRSIDAFREPLADSTRYKIERPTTTKKVDQRGMPRRPLVAKILLANNQSVIVAVCRDISVGGMQVLTDQIPGEVGDTLKLNVSPSSPEKSMTPFVAHGTIVRILEDGRGFSFRFSRLSDSAKQSIDAYIGSGS